MRRLLEVDRRWIFLVVTLVVLIPVLGRIPPVGIRPTGPVQQYRAALENLQQGDPILISADFDPGSKPELYPMLEATLRHAFRKKLRVVAMTLWVTGTGMVERALRHNAERAKEEGLDPQPGRDYVFLGWKTGGSAVIIGMGDIRKQFAGKDYYGRSLDDLPAMRGINSLGDFKLLVTFSAGSPGMLQWVQFGVEKYGIAYVGGCTGVIIPEAYPYLQAGQLKGLLGGGKGAAEYEVALGIQGDASAGMMALSFAHMAMIALIVLANVAYAASGRKERAR